ncbi:MAG: sugar phosphate isomerase/epimerase family protein [Pseudomonadota bacterium]
MPLENCRISLCNEVLRHHPFEAQCARAAALGYDGLEIAPFTLGDTPHRLSRHDIAAVRKTLSDHGLCVTSLHWLLVAPEGLSITSADPAVRARTIAVADGLIDLAAELGAGVLVHGSPSQRALTPGDEAGGRARAKAFFAHAGERAFAAGLRYAIEPLARNETDHINTLDEAAALVASIGVPGLVTMLDTSSAGQTEIEPLQNLIARHGSAGTIAHVQLNDPNRRGPGEGAMAFAPILRALDAAGYRGDLAVEPFIYEPDGDAVAARAIGYLRGLLEGLS